MRAVVIGATGHIGSYLVPKLVDKGYEVVAVSRGNRQPYQAELPEWKMVEHVTADRKAMEAQHTFAPMIAGLKGDIVCDLISYDVPQVKEITDALIGTAKHYFQIGSIWVYKYNLEEPVSEGHPENDDGAYGGGKARVEKYLMELSESGKLNCTVIHPGHISGRGWLPINPQGNLNKKVYEDIICGREILLPDRGQPTLHHVHSADIAGLISACLDHPDKSVGQMFHAVSPKALTLRGFAQQLYEHFGKQPKLRFLPFEQFRDEVGEQDADVTWDHISRSPCCSMEKARRLLGFVPAHSSIDTVMDALDWMMEHKQLNI